MLEPHMSHRARIADQNQRPSSRLRYCHNRSIGKFALLIRTRNTTTQTTRSSHRGARHAQNYTYHTSSMHRRKCKRARQQQASLGRTRAASGTAGWAIRGTAPAPSVSESRRRFPSLQPSPVHDTRPHGTQAQTHARARGHYYDDDSSCTA